MLFELGMALPHLQANYSAEVLTEHLPCFIADSPCLKLTGREGVCFARGGYGAPATVDTLETLHALGVDTVIVIGMCGGFAAHVQVGDILLPTRIASEEGVSRHYTAHADYAYSDEGLHRLAAAQFGMNFSLYTDDTVTTDAVYRQTFTKEALWRERGCAGVDMEASALLTVARAKGMRAVAALIVSDKHPISPDDPSWEWGNPAFREIRRQFIDASVAFAAALDRNPQV